MPGILAIDTETNGLDLYHRCKPFFFTSCDQDGRQVWFEWPVDPLTREPTVPEEDLDTIEELIHSADTLVGHNIVFDITALGTLRQSFVSKWPWQRTHDTTRLAHLLASNQPKNLTDLSNSWLGVNILPYEKALEKAVKQCRGIIQRAQLRLSRAKAKLAEGKEVDPEKLNEPLAAWKISKERTEDQPSSKGKSCWAGDYWLPAAMAELFEEGEDHPWRTVLREYSNVDSAVTVKLFQVLLEVCQRRGYGKIYEAFRPLPSVIQGMQRRGVTVSGERLEELSTDYLERSYGLARKMVGLASCYHVSNGDGQQHPYELTLPKNGLNDSLRTFCFDVLKLEKVYDPKSKSQNPTLNKGAVQHYLETLRPSSREAVFVQMMADKRSLDTAVKTYLGGYRRFWQPWIPEGTRPPTWIPEGTGLPAWTPIGQIDPETGAGWYVLHPGFNPTGTDTLRWSSSNPNGQNISKKENFNLRYVFGPAPGREWWSMDAKNVELRIPAYKSGEKELIDLFERADEPPYWGSEHFLNFSTVYPDIWEAEVKAVGLEKVGPHIKKKYAASWYQKCKNGDFAVGYGAVDRPDGLGTADRTFGRPGSHARLKERFAKKEVLNQQCITFAKKHGYVETFPDRSVDSEHGYPLVCSRTERGYIKPTVPLNFKVQGTAMWITVRGMIRTEGQLEEWRRQRFNAWITLQVHDEVVFDFPRGADPRTNPAKSNLGRAKVLQKLLAQGGDDVGVPVPFGLEWHGESYSEGVSF